MTSLPSCAPLDPVGAADAGVNAPPGRSEIQVLPGDLGERCATGGAALRRAISVPATQAAMRAKRGAHQARSAVAQPASHAARGRIAPREPLVRIGRPGRAVLAQETVQPVDATSSP